MPPLREAETAATPARAVHAGRALRPLRPFRRKTPSGTADRRRWYDGSERGRGHRRGGDAGEI